MTKKSSSMFVAAALLGLLAVPRLSQGEAPELKGSFLPPNDLQIRVGAKDAGGITREQYDAVMDRVQELYGPIIAAKGKTLVINRLWEDPTVNASAQQQGGDWIINMYGGLARHQTITQDGMALVACHELGHHIGGAPKYGGAGWASNEGESDYFANAKCLHRIFASAGAGSFTRMSTEDELAQEACGKVYAADADRKMCVRSSMAGYSVTSLFRALRNETKVPHFDTPDPAVVARTKDSHPGTQCRLDTYFAGSLCAKPYTTDMDDNDPSVGACVASQGFSVGLRPRCWYKPSDKEAPPAVASRLQSFKDPASLAALKGSEVWQGN